MSVIRHPNYPSNPNCVFLTNFPTGGATLQHNHIHWLQDHVIRPLSGNNPPWVFLRGYASHRYDNDFNNNLSLTRALRVKSYIIEQVGNASIGNRFTGVDHVGENWSGGDTNDNSARWRAVEVIVTPNRVPPPVVPDPVGPTPTQERRVRCWLIRSPRMRRPFNGSWADGGRSADIGESLWRNSEGGLAAHLMSDTEQIPVTHRIVRITYKLKTWSNSVATEQHVEVLFNWENQSGDGVISKNLIPGSGFGRERTISREQARRVYNDTAHVLRNLDYDYRRLL